MKKSQISQFETRLWVIRQMKQVSVSLLIGVSTLIFLDSIHVLSAVLHSLDNAALFPYTMCVCRLFSLRGIQPGHIGQVRLHPPHEAG